jgi:predicted dienelactone hydrolase
MQVSAATDRGARRQAYPAFGSELKSMKLTWRRTVAVALLGLALSGAALAAILWRGIPFPPPSGPHRVGRASYHLIDSSRPEIFTAASDDVRELVVTVHYPAEEDASGPVATYADAQLAAGIAQAYDAPQFLVNRMHSHALESPPCREHDTGYPIVIFSPGFGQPPLFYTATLEELASNGFVVVSVYHPYSSGIAVFPDGRVVRQNDAGSHPEDSLGYPDAAPRQERTEKDGDDVGSVWVQDVRFVLDELARLNRDDEVLAGRMDLSSVGVFGHSFGGAAAARVVQVDPRFRAGINMDGTDFTATEAGPIDRPFLWLCAPLPAITDDELAEAGKSRAWADAVLRLHRERSATLLQNSTSGSRAILRGAAHQTFASDLTLIAATAPWSWLVTGIGGADFGTIPGRRAVSMVDALVVGFFQKHLQGRPAPLLEGATSEFPEVEFELPRP